eukprot:jgi/Galph1/260/GphlegSOOS_G4923.1
MIVCHLPLGPTAFFSLSNVVMRHDIVDKELGTVSEANPHLIFDNFQTSLGQRVKNILKHLFPTPKPDSKRVITFANDTDTITFRRDDIVDKRYEHSSSHHVYRKKGSRPEDIELIEMGPRTVDETHVENEWVLRPFMNTAKKRRALG